MRISKNSFRLLSLVLLTVLVFLSSCTGNTDGPSGVSEASKTAVTSPESDSKPAAERSVVDQAGREVVVEDPVERIVSGYYIASSACLAIGLKDKLAGIEAKAADRPIYRIAAPELLQLPDVGTAKEFNMEACIALEPDLVILPKRLKDSAEILAGLGIPVILVNPESHRELVEMIRLIGRAAGAEERAETLVDYYNRELDAVAALTGSAAERPSVYLCGNGSYLSTAPNGMYQASLIDAAGGVNAAGDIDGDNWVQVSYEQIMAMDPQVIVIPPEAAYGKEEILSDAQLAHVAAVRDGRVYQMPKGFEAWDSPVPSCTLGIRWLLSSLHGELYSIDSLRSDAAAFYREFYGTEIDVSLIGK